MTTLCHSFHCVAQTDAQILILGSMPGIRSLRDNQYYAHPQNAFWKIMAHLFEFDGNASYQDRLTFLTKHKIALWDVAYQCEREGSLDSDMKNVVPNDFQSLFEKCPHIHSIFFNGAKAEQLFKKLVLKDLEKTFQMKRLPSTSPAHASLSFEEKLKLWKIILN